MAAKIIPKQTNIGPHKNCPQKHQAERKIVPKKTSSPNKNSPNKTHRPEDKQNYSRTRNIISRKKMGSKHHLMSCSADISAHLLDCGAVKINPSEPFRWASGWKSPIYCDNRLTLSFPQVRTFIKKALAENVTQRFPEAGGIAGVATAGIPQGVLVADFLSLPFLYVRSKPKAHGMGNTIEGRMPENTPLVVLEDLVSTGGSALQAIEALRAANYRVLGLVCIFTYGFPKAQRTFEQADVPFYALSSYEDLLKVAAKKGIIAPQHREVLEAWRTQPENFGV